MRAHPHNQEQVACRTAVRARIALSLQANTLSIARSCLDPELHSFRAIDHAFAMTRRTIARRASGPIAARTRNVELHAPAHLRHVSRSITLRARRIAARL